MQCPYCKEDMEVGQIRNPREIAWIKGNEKHTVSARFLKDSVILSELNAQTFFEGNSVRAYLCRKCRKVIINY